MFSKGRELYGLFEARAGDPRSAATCSSSRATWTWSRWPSSGFANAVATLGTACTAEHVQKLFRFTDTVVFSFDGDAAGRRAAARALEAPCRTPATPQHPVPVPAARARSRQLHPRARRRRVRALRRQAVPLSLQLLEAAREGCDLGTAEGRAHMLANARPLWTRAARGRAQAPDARRDRRPGGCPRSTCPACGAALPRRRSVLAPAPRHRARRRARHSASAAAPPTCSTARCGCWCSAAISGRTLDGESHDLLARQAAPYDAFFGCLERSWHDHGPLGNAVALLDELRAQAEASGADAVIGSAGRSTSRFVICRAGSRARPVASCLASRRLP